MSHQHMLERVSARYRDLDEAGADPQELLNQLVVEEAPLLDQVSRQAAVDSLHAQLSGFGALQEYCDDPAVTDVLVNGDGTVWVERHGSLERTHTMLEPSDALHIVERILGPIGLKADRASPIADGRLHDGSRISVVLPPISLDGPTISIRRFAARSVAIEAFAPFDVVEYLKACVAGRANIVVYGATGCGKTTLLNALCAQLPVGERIITVEDTAELRLGRAHVVRLEARRSNSEGKGEVAIRELIRAALRMRPDRIIVGEVRGPEALDMIWAMSTGHDGSLSTCHATTASDAIGRLETFALLADAALPLEAVRSQVRSAVDVLIGVERAEGGRRRVHSIDLIDHSVGSSGTDGVVPVVRRGAYLPKPARAMVPSPIPDPSSDHRQVAE